MNSTKNGKCVTLAWVLWSFTGARWLSRQCRADGGALAHLSCVILPSSHLLGMGEPSPSPENTLRQQLQSDPTQHPGGIGSIADPHFSTKQGSYPGCAVQSPPALPSREITAQFAVYGLSLGIPHPLRALSSDQHLQTLALLQNKCS